MTRLRELAEAYAANKIDQATYRSTRRNLIKNICSGKIKLPVQQYLKPLLLPDETHNKTIDKDSIVLYPELVSTLPIATLYKQWLEFFSWKNIVIISIGILAITAVFWFTVSLTRTVEYKPVNTQLTHVPQWKNLITKFIQQRTWQANNIQAFLVSWKLLSIEELNDVKNSTEMKRLANAIYQQLSNKHALLSLGGDVEQVISEQQRLVNFANALGINDRRLIVIRPTSR